jgi:hypothetical protein
MKPPYAMDNDFTSNFLISYISSTVKKDVVEISRMLVAYSESYFITVLFGVQISLPLDKKIWRAAWWV